MTLSRDEALRVAQELVDARTAWLGQHGVPISMEFVRFANAIGAAAEVLRELGTEPSQPCTCVAIEAGDAYWIEEDAECPMHRRRV